MGNVVHLRRHKLHGAWCCRADEGGRECFVCSGGLALCTVCFGGESSLPTECPGRQMTHEEQDAVTAGIKDFKDGEWTHGTWSAPVTGHMPSSGSLGPWTGGTHWDPPNPNEGGAA